jgi:aryl-alcohol dehydrogenase-like predicted oxidoreductase
MRSRLFNHTDRHISEIGLGCWQLGGADWGNVSDETAVAILRAAVESGVDFFDTADVYGNGRSETLIGQFLRQQKTRIFVATKLGRFPDPGLPGNLSLQNFRKHTEASLRRLGVESLDLTQLHCIPTEAMRSGECFNWLRTLKKEGKIKAFGASVESMDEAMICLKQEGLASLQIIFNIFRQKPIDVLFEQAKEKGVALIVRLPIASGLLSGKMTRQTHFSKNDHREFNRNGETFNVGETFAGLPFEKGVELADELKTMVPNGMTLPQMALRWCLDFDAVTTVIPGASRAEQARTNAEVSKLPPLSAELHKKLSSFYRDKVASNIRGPY